MNGKGTLTVRVYISRAKLPLSDATVVVTQRSEGESTSCCQFRLLTGADPPARWTSPPPSWRTAYSRGMERPPTRCAMCGREHPGYAMLLVEGVQIFDGVDTLQEMELSPAQRRGIQPGPGADPGDHRTEPVR